jgi:hypothetical protein
MIIHNRKRRDIFIGSILLGIITVLLFIYLRSVYQIPPIPSYLYLILYSLSGFFIIIAAGMLISPDSRISGILFLIIFVSLTLYFGLSRFAAGNAISIYGLLAGVLTALLLMVYVVRFNRFDVLAISAKALLTVFFMVILAYFISSFFLANGEIQAANPGSTDILIQNLFFYGVGLVITVLFYILLLYSVVGVKASDIFIFGPRNSGKTYFLLGFYEYITQPDIGGEGGESIVFSESDIDEENLKLDTMYSKAHFGEVISRTPNYVMGIYELLGWKMFAGYRITPIRWKMVDYSGEHYDILNGPSFKKSMEFLGKTLGLSLIDVYKKVATKRFYRDLKENHRDKLGDVEFRRSLVISALYSHLLHAGKVIFLVDGDKLLDPSGNQKLAREFGQYYRIIRDIEGWKLWNFFGANKKYAFVVTKSDRVVNQYLGTSADPNEFVNMLRRYEIKIFPDIPENSDTAVKVEEYFRSLLNDIATYRALEHHLNDINLSFLAVSSDRNAMTLETGMATPLKLQPWRFSQIFKFGA